MDGLGWNLVDLTVALTLLGLGLAFPFRPLAAKPEIIWDITAVLASIAFALSIDFALDAGLDWTLTFTGIGHWIDVWAQWPFWVLLAGNLVVGDLFGYWAHRLLHTSTLWHTHAWHHSPKHLYWAAGLRASPVHVLAIFVPAYASHLLFPVPEASAAAVAAIVVDTVNQHFTHTNVRVPFTRLVERILVTPRFHFAHHSANLERSNSNFGFTFTWWDRMFGTYTDPDTVPADDPLGLNYAASRWRMLLGIPAARKK